jgi:hypothetical protein
MAMRRGRSTSAMGGFQRLNENDAKAQPNTGTEIEKKLHRPRIRYGEFKLEIRSRPRKDSNLPEKSSCFWMIRLRCLNFLEHIGRSRYLKLHLNLSPFKP